MNYYLTLSFSYLEFVSLCYSFTKLNSTTYKQKQVELATDDPENDSAPPTTLSSATIRHEIKNLIWNIWNNKSLQVILGLIAFYKY